MTNYRPNGQRLKPDPWLGRSPSVIIMSTPEDEAVLSGVQAGDAALVQFGASGVLRLFVERRQATKAAPKLEVLRSYAELRRALLTQGYNVPATILAAAGYTAAEIARFDGMIAVDPPTIRWGPETTTYRTQAEIG